MAPPRIAIILSILSFIIFCIGLCSLFFLAEKPGLFSQNVYIDENGLLAGSTRPSQYDPEMVYQIHTLLQTCYQPTPQSILLQYTFTHCLSGIAQSLGFHSIPHSSTILTLHYDAPRSSGAESMLFTAQLHPHELSSSISSLSIILSSIISAHHAGYLSRDVVIYVPIPTPIQFNTFILQQQKANLNDHLNNINNDNNNNQDNIYQLSKNEQLRHEYNKITTYIQQNPLESYQTWSKQYLQQLTEYISLSTMSFFQPGLPFSSIGFNLLPFTNDNTLTLQSIYPKGHQSNLDLASTMFSALSTTGNPVTVHQSPFPNRLLTSTTQLTNNNKNNNNNDNNNLHPILIHSTIDCNLPILSILTQIIQYVDTHFISTLSIDATGYLNYLFAQYNSQPSQYLHSSFGDSNIDSLTVSTIISKLNYNQYQDILSNHFDDIYIHNNNDNDLKNNNSNNNNKSDHTNTTPTPTELRLHYTPPQHLPSKETFSQYTLTRQITGLELWLRMLSNSHEKLHHSTWLYLLSSDETFSGMSKYAPIFALLWSPLPLLALYGYFVPNSKYYHTASEIPYGLLAILLSFILGFIPSLLTTIGSYIPLLLTLEIQIIFTMLFVLIYLYYIWYITLKLQTSGWFILISILIAPLSLMNFAYSLILLFFVIPNLLFNFAPIIWSQQQITTTTTTETSLESSTTTITPIKTNLKSKLKIILLSLLRLIILCILSPIGWHFIHQGIILYTTSTLSHSCLFSKHITTLQLGWNGCPNHIIPNQLTFFQHVINNHHNSIPNIMSIFTTINGLTLQQIAYWTVYIPTFSICFAATIQQLLGKRT